MLPMMRAGVAALDGSAAFARVTERVIGNQLPGWTGSAGDNHDKAGPHPDSQVMGGQVGHFDGSSGSDPWVAKLQPSPRSPVVGAWSEGDPGSRPGESGPPLGYGQGASRIGPGASGAAARLGAPSREQLLPSGRPSWWRAGIIGFNDQLQVRDRHVYWDRGTQRFRGPGIETGGGRNPQLDGRARPDLRAVNISVNPQIGSDHTRNADDLTRPYTWLGQQDGTVQPVYGGVPGLWVSYGNRGFAHGIHDPSNGQGGLAVVYPGPPHGLHSDTIPSGKQIADRYRVVPQMRPVRIDRPDNSRIAGQSYSQTVLPQGATQGQPRQAPPSLRAGISLRAGGRGWRGGPE